ncbi:MAG: hypothetical protein ACFB20_06790 [Opitutales bacterium]
MKIIVREGKFLLALGGFAGFMVSFFGTMVGGGEAIVALRNGSIGCLIGFFLCKGAMIVVLHNMQAVLERKYRERMRQAREEAERVAEEEAAVAERAAAEALGQVASRLRPNEAADNQAGEAQPQTQAQPVGAEL